MKKLTSCILLILVCLMATVVFAESTPNRTIELTDTEIILFKGDNHNIKATVTAVTEDAPKQTQLVWESADTTIATVAQNGTVNGKAAGETILTCRAKDDEAVFATVKVTVVLPVEKVVPAEKNVTLLLREEGVVIEQQLTVAVEPADAYCTKLVWKSSNEKVVTVDENGKLTAVGKGTANITVTSAEERKGKEPRRNSISVTVNQGVTAIEQGDPDVAVGKGRSLKLTAKVVPETANNKALVWTTSDPAIATVEGGNVTGKDLGECVITATAKDGSGVSVSYNITVVQQITSLTLKNSTLSVFEDTIAVAHCTIKPDNATNRVLKWTSSDVTIAKVNDMGVITPVKAGTCTITAETTDGSKKTAQVKVTVKKVIDLEAAYQKAKQYKCSNKKVSNHIVDSSASLSGNKLSFKYKTLNAQYRQIEVQINLSAGKDRKTVSPELQITLFDVWKAMSWSSPTEVEVKVNGRRHTIPSGSWSELGGVVFLHLENDPELYEKIVNADKTEILVWYGYSSEKYTIQKGTPNHNAVKAGWEVWKASGAANLYEERLEVVTPTPLPVGTPSPDELARPKVGDIITYGAYEQDNKTGNGPEDLQWQVLAVEEDRMLLITTTLIDNPYYLLPELEKTVKLSWQDSSLRKWLNEDFYSATFAVREKNRILTTNVENDDASGKYTTQDKVFCLSIREAKKYLGDKEKLNCKASPYARAKLGELPSDSFWMDNKGNGCWWLRDVIEVEDHTGKYTFDFMNAPLNIVALAQGWSMGVRTDMSIGIDKTLVRPAMWVSLKENPEQEKEDIEESAGNQGEAAVLGGLSLEDRGEMFAPLNIPAEFLATIESRIPDAFVRSEEFGEWCVGKQDNLHVVQMETVGLIKEENGNAVPVQAVIVVGGDEKAATVIVLLYPEEMPLSLKTAQYMVTTLNANVEKGWGNAALLPVEGENGEKAFALIFDSDRSQELITAFSANNTILFSALEIRLDVNNAHIIRFDIENKPGFANAWNAREKENNYSNASVGSYVTFGSYEQDNNTANGKEPIEWLVLAKEENRLLVVSRYALDCKPYNEKYTDVTWETCTLRKWLNNDFLKTAFGNTEQAMIPTVTVSADKNPSHNTKPGNATQDKVFLLSIPEVDKYFASDSAVRCNPTADAQKQGADTDSNGFTWWWLRSPGDDQNCAAFVWGDGGVYEYGNYVNRDNIAIRPALWINVEP